MDKKVDWMKTPTEEFLLKANDFTNERDAAEYFGMNMTDYRSTRLAARVASRANLVFTVRYYQGTHPMETMAEVAAGLGIAESTVKELLQNG